MAHGGGAKERSESGSAVLENHHRHTQNHTVNEGTWSTARQGPMVPHDQVYGDQPQRIRLRSVFGLVLVDLCSFWPETSRFGISVMRTWKGN